MRNNNVVTILGGTGFLGKHLIRQLVRHGYLINVISRNALQSDDIKTCGNIGQVMYHNADVSMPDRIYKCIEHSKYVVNLVGIFHETKSQTFDKVHKRAAMQIAKMCENASVEKLIHMSGLRVDRAINCKYAASKYEAEQAISFCFKHSYILRSSALFGIGDKFISSFIDIIMQANRFCSPFIATGLIPLPLKGAMKVQPVFVEDIASVITKIITEDNVSYGTYKFGGPQIFTLKQLIEYIAMKLNKRAIVVNMPNIIANLYAAFEECRVYPKLTREQLKFMRYDNIISNANDFELFDIAPKSIETMLPSMISAFNIDNES